jgi:hypothetical protein
LHPTKRAIARSNRYLRSEDELLASQHLQHGLSDFVADVGK